MAFTSQRAARIIFLLRGCALLLLFMLIYVYVQSHPEWVQREAFVYDSICRELFKNSTEGRQALVSSVWWPPFSSLVRLPFVWLSRPDFPAASVCTSLLFACLAIWRMNRGFARLRLGPIRWVLLTAMAMNPLFLASAVSGSSAMPVLFFAILTAESIFLWIIARSLRSFVYFAIASSILTGMCPYAACWCLPLFGLLFYDTYSGSFMPARRHAVWLLALMPVFYVVVLWILFNWLVMGDALYFVRSLFASVPDRAPDLETRIAHRALPALSLLVSIPAVLAAFRADRRLALPVSLVSVVPVLLSFLFVWLGLAWPDSILVQLCLPLSIISAGTVISRNHPETRIAGGLALMAFVVVAIVFALSLAPKGGEWEGRKEIAPSDERFSHLFAVERYVVRKSRYAKVFMCGYDALALCESGPRGIFTPAMDLDFGKARKDYQGHKIFVMVRKPAGKSGMDSVHWKYPGGYTLGGEGTLYDGDWGDWRLFEVIQAPVR